VPASAGGKTRGANRPAGFVFSAPIFNGIGRAIAASAAYTNRAGRITNIIEVTRHQ
jgi:hypothetical protein